MEYGQSQSEVLGYISGAAALYWTAYCCHWTYGYYRSYQDLVWLSLHSASLPQPSVPFHLSALLFQVLAIVYFAINCVYEAALRTSGVMCDVNWVVYSLYITAAYVVGMSFLLGFGTLHTTIPPRDKAVLAAQGVVVLAVCMLEFLENDAARYIEVALLLLLFVCGLVLGARTLRTMAKRIRWGNSEGYCIYAAALASCKRKLSLMLLLFCVLFLVLVLDETVSRKEPVAAVQITLWAVLVVTQTAVNSWMLRLIRPSPALMDVQVIENQLKSLVSM